MSYFSRHFLSIVFILQIALYLSLFLNLTIARQVIGIIYLTLIPGFIAIKLLNLQNLSQLEQILFAVGFSLAFLMITGLALNTFGPLFELEMPLSTLPLYLVLNTIILIGAVVTQYKEKKALIPQVKNSNFKFTPLFFLLVLLPILSIIGTYYVNLTADSSILMFMITAIAIVFAALAFFERATIERIYPFAIFMIALALLLHFSLISNYIVPYGGDSPVELYVFRTSQQNSFWNPILPFATSDEPIARMNAMLSVTVLPTVFSNMISLDSTWIYKAVYPLLFAILPVALYVLWQPYIGKKFSFFAAFLFMAQSTFYTEMMALGRQLIAEIFFVLLLIIILNPKMKLQTKYFTFMLFSFGLIFSHYALSEIFLILIFVAWLVSKWLLKRPSINLQLGMIVFFFVAMFLWYIYNSGSVVFNSFLTFTGYVYNQLGDFFNPFSRGTSVLTGLGLAESPSILNTISRIFAYITEVFILIGIVSLVTKKTKFRFDRDFTVFSLVAMLFLAALTIVPGLANTLNMTRFYHILLMLLAPFCIVGIWAFIKFLAKKEKKFIVSLLVVVVLVPYFLFQTNYMYEVAKTDSWSIPLSSGRMNPLRLYGDFGYIDIASVRGAEWVHNYVPYEHNITGDNGFYTSLTAYGLVYRGYVLEIRNDTVLFPGQYAYLSYISMNFENQTWNGTLDKVLNQTNIIYSNGDSEVRCSHIND